MHDFFGAIVGCAFFACIAAIFVVPAILKYRERERMQDILRMSIEKGQPLPLDTIESMRSATPVPMRPSSEMDLRRGVTMVCTGLGLVGLGYGAWYGFMSVNEIPAYIIGGLLAGVGAIPGLIGIGHLILWATSRRTTVHEPVRTAGPTVSGPTV